MTPYSDLPSLILGFHGCDHAVAKAVVNDRIPLKVSTNTYDWLGSGIYFWENSPERAMEWAQDHAAAGKLKKPAVIGAVIDPGLCLDLLDRHGLKLVQQTHKSLLAAARLAGTPLPVNRKGRQDLDCAVINGVHTEHGPFDTVRAAFFEGEPLYKGSGFRTKNHIQICVRNVAVIKACFHP